CRPASHHRGPAPSPPTGPVASSRAPPRPPPPANFVESRPPPYQGSIREGRSGARNGPDGGPQLRSFGRANRRNRERETRSGAGCGRAEIGALDRTQGKTRAAGRAAVRGDGICPEWARSKRSLARGRARSARATDLCLDEPSRLSQGAPGFEEIIGGPVRSRGRLSRREC